MTTAIKNDARFLRGGCLQAESKLQTLVADALKQEYYQRLANIDRIGKTSLESERRSLVCEMSGRMTSIFAESTGEDDLRPVIATPLLQPRERVQVVDDFLTQASRSSVILGKAVCCAVECMDRRLVERLLAERKIPAGKWLEAVRLAVKKNERAIVEVLFRYERVSARERCWTFCDAYQKNYQGHLDRLLDFVPHRERFLPIMINYAKGLDEPIPGLVEELEFIKSAAEQQ